MNCRYPCEMEGVAIREMEGTGCRPQGEREGATGNFSCCDKRRVLVAPGADVTG